MANDVVQCVTSAAAAASGVLPVGRELYPGPGIYNMKCVYDGADLKILSGCV
ncbi:hypothetical protein CERSUDRAFT_88648 [Gelatoporia subvermispora B]|uniref:Uncharacterized protein n=1 Tax=Ceriporiopsis subvermispora (strain B) TaxID=914234 RepID=M2Q4M0_CERS8|nr:hypothetical protein CERSUDRAFT_88648 [Gelatoporia subvermispora B]